MRSIFLIFLFLGFLLPIAAQPINAEMRVAEKQILIGDAIHLKVTVTYPSDYNIEVIDFQDSSKVFEVVQHTKPIKGNVGNQQHWEESYQLTCFDSGNWVIPGMKVKFQKKGAKEWEFLTTQAAPIVVQNVPTDTTQAIKPIKAPLETTYQWKEAIPYALLVGAILGLVLVIFYFVGRGKQKVKKVVPPPQPRFLQEVVLEKLESLEKQQVWQGGNYKLYYTNLTDILRFYLEKRYQISTFEATSDEILAKLEDKVEKNHLYSLQGILQTADLVKFAKLIPESEDHTYQMEMAKKWVKATANLLKI